jgi:hypothetical protein
MYSLGLGVQLNLSAGSVFAPGVAVAISPADSVHLAINWYLDFENVNTLGLTLDVCPLTFPLSTFKAGSLNFTLGVGLFTNIILINNPGISGGLRVPIGFNLFLGKNVIELYTHIAPSFGLRFLPSLGLSNPFFPIALGARIWFR